MPIKNMKYQNQKMIKLHQNIKLNPKLIFYSYYLLLSYDYFYSFEQMQDLLKI